MLTRQCAGVVDRPDGTRHRCHRTARRGTTVCGGRGSHGGNAGQVVAKAAERVAEATALAVYERYSVNGDGPVDILGQLGHLAGEVTKFLDFATGRIAALSADQWAAGDQPAVHAAVGLFERACDRAGRLLTDLARIGVAAIEADTLNQRYGDEMADAIAAVLARYGLNPRRADVRAAVYAELRQQIAERRAHGG